MLIACTVTRASCTAENENEELYAPFHFLMLVPYRLHGFLTFATNEENSVQWPIISLSETEINTFHSRKCKECVNFIYIFSQGYD